MFLVSDRHQVIINSPIPKEKHHKAIFTFVVCIGYKFKDYMKGYYYNLLSTGAKHSTMASASYLMHNTSYCQWNVKTKFLFLIVFSHIIIPLPYFIVLVFLSCPEVNTKTMFKTQAVVLLLITRKSVW